MEQRTTPSNSTFQAGLGVGFLHALNAAAASLQRSARSEAEVFRAVREQIVGLGLRGGLGLLDEKGEHLTIRAVAQPEAMMKVLTVLEKLAGIKAEGYTYPVASVAAYRQVVETGQALFMAESSAAVAQLMPEAARPWAGRILDAFGRLPGIFAPLNNEGKVVGVLNVVGSGLTPGDLPAMVAFANHIAVALENARLFATLHFSEKRFRALIENSSDGIVLLSAEGTILYDGPSLTRILGYAADERIGRSAFEFMHPDDRQASAERFVQFARKPGAVVSSQARFRHTDGSWRWIEGIRSNLLDEPSVQAIVINYRDMTERVRAEQRLAAQYAVARCLAASDTLADAAPKILQAICESLEWDQGEVWSVLWNADLQANVLRCVGTWHPPSASFPEFEAVTRQIEFARGVGLPGRVWASGEPAWIPDVTQDANFPRAPVAAKEGLRAGFAFPLKPDGGVLGVMGFFSREIRQPDNDLLQTFTGISNQTSQFIKRKQAEAALGMSEERYRVVAEAASDVIIVIDEDSRIRFINPASRNVFGYTAAELIGESLTLLMPESLQRRHLAAFQRYLESGQRSMDWRTVELAGRRKDGSEIPLEISFGESASEGKRFFAGVVRDIAERKRAEAGLAVKNEELRAMTQQLWQTAKLATMGELAASIAHELNNPLGTVGLRVESLSAQIPSGDPIQRELKVIEQEVDRMGTLVANLLQFSRRGTQQISSVEVPEEIDRTLELIHFHLSQRQVAVVRDFAPDVPLIQADRQQLRQLFLNLFTNAADAMPEGGTLTIRVSAVENQALIEIMDSGIGIAPEDLPKVIEPFFTTKPEGKGTGLGLAICRRVVQEHGGTLTIASAGPRQGATARVTLPIPNKTNGQALKAV